MKDRQPLLLRGSPLSSWVQETPPHTHSHTHIDAHAQGEILTHSFDFCDSDFKGVDEKAIEAGVDISHVVGHSPSLHSPKRESSGHGANKK